MSATLPKPRELQRRTALAHLDAEELRLAIENKLASISASPKPSSVPPAVLGALLESLAELTQRILERLDVPVGVTVGQAAERLDVTPPTIRKWLREGLLRTTAGRKPVEVDPRSLIELQGPLATVRETYPSRQWSKALAAYLHDRELQDQPWAVEGRHEFERGEFVER